MRSKFSFPLCFPFSVLHLVGVLSLTIFTSGLLGQTVTTVLNFTGNNGIWPTGPWTQGRDGRLYGTTSYGGVRNGISVPAAFVRFDPSAQNLTIYHRFNDFDGQNVSGGVTLGSDNYFYGTTTSSASDCGLLYRITVNGTYTVLHNFGGGSDGCGPVGPPIEATDGNFYGIAGPTIYKFTRDGVFSALFTWWSGDGLMDGLMQASDGKLWATVRGGSYPECGFNLRIALYGGLLNVGNFCTPDGYSILPLGPLLAGCGKTDWQRVFLSMIPCWRC